MQQDNKEVSIKQQVEARAAEWVKAERSGKGSGDTDQLSFKFISDCLDCNELGDGILYSAITDYDFIFESKAGHWYFWNGNFYDLDIEGRSAAAMESIVSEYLRYFEYLNTKVPKSNEEGNWIEARKKDLLRRIRRLRSVRGRSNALQFSCSNPQKSLVVKAEDFDKDPVLLGSLNSVIFLRTGYGKPGRIR